MEVVENLWIKSKLLVKGLIIGGLILLLLIPTYYVRNLIEEREARQKEAISEVSSKWAGKQNITGPVISIPYWENTGEAATGKPRIRQMAYFLPDELNINAVVSPQEKYRGIYKVLLYNSEVRVNGSFRNVDPARLMIPEEDLIWNEATVQVQLSDVKGLNEELKINWNGNELALMPSHDLNAEEDERLVAALPITGPGDLKEGNFSAIINLSGSEQLLFTPIGRSTTATLRSDWPHPSFTGNILPQLTQVKDSGFTATWKSLAHKRNFPQQWRGNAFTTYSNPSPRYSNNNLYTSSFGSNLFIPVNGYQKTMRSIKYAALCLLLTFAAFFLIETTHKRSVHPFQYGLIGLALVLFYTLLLSFSEYIGFDLSYAVASLLTIALIAWFVKGLLCSGKLTIILASVLALMYTYVFTILQLQDYSLLLGSLGLFITLAVIMHFSKKINW